MRLLQCNILRLRRKSLSQLALQLNNKKAFMLGFDVGPGKKGQAGVIRNHPESRQSTEDVKQP